MICTLYFCNAIYLFIYELPLVGYLKIMVNKLFQKKIYIISKENYKIVKLF